MEAFLSQYGITTNDVINIIAIVAVLLLLLGVFRWLLRLTRTVVRIGCAAIVIIGIGLLLLSFLNPI